jgi:hypothetical protein
MCLAKDLLPYSEETTTHPSSHPVHLRYILGRAIAQVVSRWLPTTVAQVRARVWQVTFVVEMGQVFSKYFGFPCQSLFHQILHHYNQLGQAQ